MHRHTQIHINTNIYTRALHMQRRAQTHVHKHTYTQREITVQIFIIIL